MSSSSSVIMMQGERGKEEVGSLVAFSGDLPPGLRFQPTDVQILDFYLRNKLMWSSSATVPSCLIQEFDVYSTEPWNLPSDSFRYQNLETAMHFFTPRHATSSRSRRASRTAGCGVWHCNGRDNLINVGSRLIGHKTQLTFMILKGKDNEKKKKKTDWIMHEFRLQTPNNTMDFDDMVLCKIYKKRSNNCCMEGEEEEEATQRLAKRKRVEEHDCLMADNDEAGTPEIVYSESSSQHSPLLPASSSSLSDMSQLVSREKEPEGLSTLMASDTVYSQPFSEYTSLLFADSVENSDFLFASSSDMSQLVSRDKEPEGLSTLMLSDTVYSQPFGEYTSLLFADSVENSDFLFASSSDMSQLVSRDKEPEGLSTLMLSDTVYSQPFGEYTSLLFADSVENSDFLFASSSDMPQSVPREEQEGPSTPLASDNVAASVAAAVGEQGGEEAEAAQERRVPEELAVMTGTSGVVHPEPSTQDTLLFSSSSASLPDMFPSVLGEEPEGLAPLTLDDFDIILSSFDDLPQLLVDDFEVDSMFPAGYFTLADGAEYLGSK